MVLSYLRNIRTNARGQLLSPPWSFFLSTPLSLSTQSLSFNSSSLISGPILPLSLPPVELSVDTEPSITQSTQILCYSLLWRANVFFKMGLWLLTVKYVAHVAPDSLLSELH